MKSPVATSLLMGILMVSSGIVAKVMTPAIELNNPQSKLSLETMIPGKFGSWKLYSSTVPLMVNPDIQGVLNKVYNQTLSRIYINTEGEHVMLSIAYGSNQSSDMHVHRPEICYISAGFDIGIMTKTFVDTTIGQIPVMRLIATQGARNEPITYWIRVGDSLTRGWFEQKLTAMAYGLTGKIPDGLLFRVSTISNDENNSFRIQQKFLSDLLQAMQQEDRYWLVGRLAHGNTGVMPELKK
jgi:EpsI family protein